jgi:ribosomal protein S18 acetylase RimI-like enzyme
MSDLLLERLDAYLDEAPRGTCDVESIGPFTCFFHRVSDHPFLSYARPRADGSGDLKRWVAALRERFTERARRVRLEYLEERVPELTAALLDAGLSDLSRYPLMAVMAPEFRSEEVPGLVVRRVRQGDDFWKLRAVAARAFGEHDVAEEDVETMRESLQRSRLFAAFLADVPVAIGSHTPIGPLSEVVGIAVDPPSWGRRIGGAVTAAVTADVFVSGCETAFLMAADGRASRLYGRLGYRPVGTAIGIMDPESEDET